MMMTKQLMQDMWSLQRRIDAKLGDHTRDSPPKSGGRPCVSKTLEFEYGGDDLMLLRANRLRHDRSRDR